MNSKKYILVDRVKSKSSNITQSNLKVISKELNSNKKLTLSDIMQNGSSTDTSMRLLSTSNNSINLFIGNFDDNNSDFRHSLMLSKKLRRYSGGVANSVNYLEVENGSGSVVTNYSKLINKSTETLKSDVIYGHLSTTSHLGGNISLIIGFHNTAEIENSGNINGVYGNSNTTKSKGEDSGITKYLIGNFNKTEVINPNRTTNNLYVYQGDATFLAGTKATNVSLMHLRCVAHSSTVIGNELVYINLNGSAMSADMTGKKHRVIQSNINAPSTFVGSIEAGMLKTASVIKQKNYTVATLPVGERGDMTYVTDATTPTYLGTLVGGGTVTCPVFFNGTEWVTH